MRITDTKTSIGKASSRPQQLLVTATGEALLLIICMIPGLVFSFKSLQSPWTMFRIARANLALQERHIPTFVTSAASYRSEHIGGEIIQVALLEATGWSLESVALVPIGSLLLPLMYYSVSQKVARSPKTAAAIALYASWYYPRLYTQFGTQTYVWTNILFLTFITLLLYWLHERKPIGSALIMVVFVASFLHYHTTPLWIIVAMATSVAAIKVRESCDKTLRPMVSWALPLFCAVLYLGFDTVVYGNGLVRLRTEAIGESFTQSVVNKIVTPLLAKPPDTPSPFEIAPINPRIATWTTLLILLLLTIPVGIWCIAKAYQAFVARDLRVLVHAEEDIFVWMVILVAVVHALAYSIYGALSLRVIPLAFPLILPPVARQLGGSDRVELILTCGLATFAVVGFLSFGSALLPDTIASETGLASKLLEPDSRLMCSADVYGSLLLNATEDGKISDFVWLDSDRYASVIGQRPVSRADFDYVVIDMSGKPITSSNWRFLEPWTQHALEINENSDLSKIYDSETIMVFQPKGATLPNHEIRPGDIKAVDGSSSIDAFWLFLTMVSLAFIPGGILTFILLNGSHLRIEDTRTPVGLSIGLSFALVTFIGYIANFTVLGLGWFVPLSVTLPWIVFAVQLIIRQPHLRACWPWVIRGSSILMALAIGSLLSAGVTHARTLRRAEFTEFFVTQNDPQSRTLTIHAVNRLNEPSNFTMVFRSAGVELETRGPRTLSSNALWTEQWQVPPSQVDRRIVITLEKDDIPYRVLHLSELPSSVGDEDGPGAAKPGSEQQRSSF
jgi:hypothetical protein